MAQVVGKDCEPHSWLEAHKTWMRESFSYHGLRRNKQRSICQNLLFRNTFLLFREKEIDTSNRESHSLNRNTTMGADMRPP